MTTDGTPTLFARVRRWLAAVDPSTDEALVSRFAATRDEAAFAALVSRHGPMVLGVARRVVGDHHAAEDVAQATFLALARHAAALRRPSALPAWLHRTATAIALTARRAQARRDRAEACTPARPPADPVAELSAREMLGVLDEELHRLPERYRLPLVLCGLEGLSQEAAARRLGWTPGAVRGRLERGRRRLRAQLARRGADFAVGAALPLWLGAAPALGVLRGRLLAAASGPVAPTVAALADAAFASSLPAAWKAAVVLVGLVGLGGGVAALALRSADQRPPTVPPVPARRAAPDPEALPDGAVARLGSPRLRIGNSAFALAPDAKAVIAVSPEGIVRTFDAADGHALGRRQLFDRRDTDPTGQPTAQLSADGSVVAIVDGTGDRRVSVYDVATGALLARRQSTDDVPVGYAALSPDGRKLAVVEGRTLRVVDVATGKVTDLGPVEVNLYSAQFSADGSRMVVEQTSARRPNAKTFACFDATAGKLLWTLPRTGQGFALSPDGCTIVSPSLRTGPGQANGFQVIDTDAATGRPSEWFAPSQYAHPNVRVAIAPDNRTVAMVHFDEIVAWDFRTPGEARRIPLPANNARGYGPNLGGFSPDGRTLLINCGHLQRWDLAGAKPLFAPPPEDGLHGPVERIAFSPDGKSLVASAWSDETARWDLTTGGRSAVERKRYGHHWTATPDGPRALIVDSYRTPHQAELADPLSGQSDKTVSWAKAGEVGINGLRAYALTADGKTLLTAHGDEPRAAPNRTYVTACDVATGRRLSQFAVTGHLYFPQPPFSPCGRWVVLAGRVYEVATGQELFAPTAGDGERLIAGGRSADSPVWFSVDGRYLAGRLSLGVGSLAVWEVPSRRLVARFPHTGVVQQVAFAPGGGKVAFLDGRGVTVCDLPDGQARATYAAADVNCEVTDRGCAAQTLVFAPDGKRLATGHSDGTVLIWEVPLSVVIRRPLRSSE